MNLLDKLIERKAFEYFTDCGFENSLVEFRIKELKMLIEQGYNTRAEILGLLKKVGA